MYPLIGLSLNFSIFSYSSVNAVSKAPTERKNTSTIRIERILSNNFSASGIKLVNCDKMKRGAKYETLLKKVLESKISSTIVFVLLTILLMIWFANFLTKKYAIIEKANMKRKIKVSFIHEILFNQ